MSLLLIGVSLLAAVAGSVTADGTHASRLTSDDLDVYPCHAVAVYLWVNAVNGSQPWRRFREDPRCRQRTATLFEVLQWLHDLGVPAKVIRMSGEGWPPAEPAIALISDPTTRVGHYVFLRPIDKRYLQMADSQGLVAVLPADSLRRHWAGQEVWLIVRRHWMDRMRPWLGTVLWGAGLGLLVGWAVWRLGGSRWRTGDGTA